MVNPKENAPSSLLARAHAFLAVHGASSEDDLLRHLFGALPPPSLRERLLLPLAADPRLRRDAAAIWSLSTLVQPRSDGSLRHLEYSVLAALATGARPDQARLLALAAFKARDGNVVQRFATLVRPTERVRVPGYVAAHLAQDRAELDQQPTFAEVAPQLAEALGNRPVFAMEADPLASLLRAEAVRSGVILALPAMLPLERLALALRVVASKPSLPALAARFNLPNTRPGGPENDAALVARIVPRLLSIAEERGITGLGELAQLVGEPGGATRIIDGAEGGSRLLDGAGVYAFTDAEQEVLYVGKARRLGERVTTYRSEQIALTRRMAGLLGSARSVRLDGRANELEALVLEAREIARLQPRYNTQRTARLARTWLYLPPQREAAAGKRRRSYARRRFALAESAADAPGWRLGPFRSALAASRARALARALFGLDRARQAADSAEYERLLQAAVRFLDGHTEEGLAIARRALADAGARRDHALESTWLSLVRQAADYDPHRLLLPADPRDALLCVLRSGVKGVEAYLLDRLRLVGYAVARLEQTGSELALAVLSDPHARTEKGDAPIVRRWLATLPGDARLVYLDTARPDLQLPTVATVADEVLAERRLLATALTSSEQD